MRIISGTHKRRVITPPPNFKARPTTDFAKENLFNVLANYIDFDDVSVLDLFAGTGSISYEFASRGALQVTTVELNPLHHKFITQTIEKLKLDNIKPIQTNAFIFLRQMAGRLKFDVIFADPPYDLENREQIVEMVLANQMLEDNGIFILEHSEQDDYSNHPNLLEHRKYGSVNFSIFDNKPTSNSTNKPEIETIDTIL